jgi:hypothetical protein
MNDEICIVTIDGREFRLPWVSMTCEIKYTIAINKALKKIRIPFKKIFCFDNKWYIITYNSGYMVYVHDEYSEKITALTSNIYDIQPNRKFKNI